MPDWFNDNAPKAAPAAASPAAPSGGGDWFDLYDPVRKPASAEDFAPPAPSKGWPARLGDVFAGFGKSVVGGTVETAKALADVQQGLFGGDFDALARTRDRATAIGRAQMNEVDKANVAPTLSERFGHVGASLLPVIGPAAAHAGEQIAAGNDEGYGEAAALLAPFGPAELVGKGIPPGLRAVQTAGKAAGSMAKTVAATALEAAPEIATDTALSYMTGHPAPIMTVAKVAKAIAGKVKAAKAAEADTAAAADAPAVADAPVGRPNTENAPTLTEALTGALEDLRQPEPPARVTTPPPAGLPPGYTPRASVPRRVAPEPLAAAPPADAPAPAKRLYFLKPEAEMRSAAREPVAPSDFTDPAQLPASWRARTDQPIAPLTSADVDALTAQLRASGVAPADALKAVAKNPSLPPNVRVQLITALGKVANTASRSAR